MLMPKRVKRRKQFRGSMAGKALRGNTISNGEYGLVSTEPCWICLLYTSPSPRDRQKSRMPSSA